DRANGSLEVVMNTGGIEVTAAKVHRVLQGWVPGAFVTGIDDGHWGQRVCAAGAGTAAQHILADAVRQELGAPAVPKIWLRLEALPMLENGKPDRLTLTHWLAKE